MQMYFTGKTKPTEVNTKKHVQVQSIVYDDPRRNNLFWFIGP